MAVDSGSWSASPYDRRRPFLRRSTSRHCGCIHRWRLTSRSLLMNADAAMVNHPKGMAKTDSSFFGSVDERGRPGATCSCCTTA